MSNNEVLISRVSSDSSDANTLVPIAYENRLIVVAQGIERHDADFVDELEIYRVLKYLKNRIPGLSLSSETFGTYTSHEQGVNFTLRIITKKDEFKSFIETPGVHVVYNGHARYGRGLCFGDDPGPGEDWENGTDPMRAGLYRMGYPFIAVSLEDIHSHRYTANVVPISEQIPRNQCHPDLRRAYSLLRTYSINNIDSSGVLINHVAGSFSPEDRIWAIKGSVGGIRGTHLILRAGWENTVSSPMDLGSTNIRCRVFCHFGCSTFKHNYRILRFEKNWRRTATDRFAYWTTAPSRFHDYLFWLFRILTYPTYNAFESWKPSLDYAVRRTNQDLRRIGVTYRII